MITYPSYLELHNTGELENRVQRLYVLMEKCRLCPRNCGARRLDGEKGVCQAAGKDAMVSSAFPHFGEEPPLTGFYGSGTIFMTHCSLRCVFCQNHDISHGGDGWAVSAGELAGLALDLQRQGCHNINFVTPTHYAPQIVEAVMIAADKGLSLPIVWNCGGYESVEALELLDGVVDIYMPDIKFMTAAPAKRYAAAPDYPDVVKQAVKEMSRQVGVLELDFRGIAKRGLLLRHLVMPGGAASSGAVMKFIAEEISPDSYVNIMDQYRPMYKAHARKEIARSITRSEYQEAINAASGCGLHRGFSRD